MRIAKFPAVARRTLPGLTVLTVCLSILGKQLK